MKYVPPTEKNSKLIIEKKYVAFCDILGFSAAITRDIEVTISFYKAFSRQTLAFSNITDAVKITIYSDSILIVGESLAPVLSTIQLLWWAALSNNFLVRGGVAYGDYWSEANDGHFFVVSNALVQAVKLEATVGDPVVVLADDIDIPEDMWKHRFSPTNDDGTFDESEQIQPIFGIPVLHFRDKNIVNPFNKYWFASAGNKVRQMLEAHPNHSDKYNWFLDLSQAVQDEELLIPKKLFDKWVAVGKLIPPSKTE